MSRELFVVPVSRRSHADIPFSCFLLCEKQVRTFFEKHKILPCLMSLYEWNMRMLIDYFRSGCQAIFTHLTSCKSNGTYRLARISDDSGTGFY